MQLGPDPAPGECTVLRPVALIKIMLFGIITVNSAPIEERDNRVERNTKGAKMKGPRTSLALFWELMEPLSICSHTDGAERDPTPILTLGCRDAEMQFVLLSAKITEGEQ